MNTNLPEVLSKALADVRPRNRARRRFESALSYGRHAGPPPPSARRAAVMALLYPGEEEWILPLIKRPPGSGVHSGQIALPGGLVEPGETSREAALRELHEEIGVAPKRVRVLGRLADLYIFASNFVVTPWVGAVDKVPKWKLNENEVELLLEPPLTHLLDPANAQSGVREVRAVRFRSPYIALSDHQIWGATSLILGELIEIFAELPGM